MKKKKKKGPVLNPKSKKPKPGEVEKRKKGGMCPPTNKETDEQKEVPRTK
jgi:hypothetical protein